MATASETGDGVRLSPTGEKLIPVTTRAATPRSAFADPWGLLRWGKYCGNGGGELTRVALHTLPFVLLLALIAVASTFVLGGFSQQPFRQSLIVPLSVSKMSSPTPTAATLAASSAGDPAAFDGESSRLAVDGGSVFGEFADPGASAESAQRAEVAEAESAETGVAEVSAREAAEGSPEDERVGSAADVTVRKEKEKGTGRPGKGNRGRGKEKATKRPSDNNEGGIRESAEVRAAPIMEPSIELPSDSFESHSEDSPEQEKQGAEGKRPAKPAAEGFGSSNEGLKGVDADESDSSEASSSESVSVDGSTNGSLVATEANQNVAREGPTSQEETQESSSDDVAAASTVEKAPNETASTAGVASTGESTGDASTVEITPVQKSTVGEARTGAAGEEQAEEAEEAERGEGTLSVTGARKAALAASAFVAVTDGDLPSRLGTLCAAPSVAAVLAARNAAQQGQKGQAEQAGREARQGMAVLWKGGDELFGRLPGKDEIWKAAAGGPAKRRGKEQLLLLQAAVGAWPELRLGNEANERSEIDMGGMVDVEVAVQPCASSSSSSSSKQGPSSLKLWAREELRLGADDGSGKVELSPQESCLVASLEAACLGGLQPSPAVAAIMRAHPASALSALPHSTAVYLEADAARAGAHPGGGCQGDSPRNYTLRTLAWRYLHAGSPSAASHPSSSSSSSTPSSSSSAPADSSPLPDFTIAAYEPSDADFVAATFHPLRAPRILPVTALRLAFCPNPESAAFDPAASPSPAPAPALLSASAPAAVAGEAKAADEAVPREAAAPETSTSSESSAEPSSESSPESPAADSSSESSSQSSSESSPESSSAVPAEPSPESSSSAEPSPAVEESKAAEAAEAWNGAPEIKEGRGEEGREGSGDESGNSSTVESHAESNTGQSQSTESTESAESAESAQETPSEFDLSAMKGRVESGEWSCLQLQVAEAWVVSAAAALIHTRASLEARFIAAQATAATARRMLGLGGGERIIGAEEGGSEGGRGAEGGRGGAGLEGDGGAEERSGLSGAGTAIGLFKVHPAVCDSKPPTPFFHRRFLQQFLVDEKLKTVYCFVPKAGCTGWKVWFREQQNRPNATDAWIAHDPLHSGLELLGNNMPEREVIRFLTRPDYFKFTFVRNPYTRLPSAYLNKHVGGGPPHDRAYWNARFFHSIAPYRQLVDRQNGSDLFDFPDFVELTWHMEKSRRCIMDPHIMPEADVCELHRIKYDYVGRFENYEHDVAEVMRRFGKDAMDAFSIGRGVHPTDASDKTVKLYNKKALALVASVYKSDLDIPLNGIHYDVPTNLKAAYVD
ncbi:hypothetical protein CLOM_g7907 [Closterium sp. NIES-68]|nr:hypothetical protein CLOM_g7907 [Closterium sp. NIES-68]GJP58243.1 hypothetical protein CLOP_g22709 [Closterium sp. NIES-67]